MPRLSVISSGLLLTLLLVALCNVAAVRIGKDQYQFGDGIAKLRLTDARERRRAPLNLRTTKRIIAEPAQLEAEAERLQWTPVKKSSSAHRSSSTASRSSPLSLMLCHPCLLPFSYMSSFGLCSCLFVCESRARLTHPILRCPAD